jgi:drug/metabolite transporter (DMT)-like permease
MAGAALCWSLAGIIIRNVTLANKWEIIFWRSFFSFVAMLLFLLFAYRAKAFASVRASGWAGVLSGAMFAIMIVFFMLAVQITTVANTQAIMSLAPFTGALFGWIVLGERLPARTLVAMSCALAGMLIMFAESLGSGRTTGNLLALAVPIAYGVNVTLLRRAGKQVDMMPAVLLGSLMSALAALIFSMPLAARLGDLGLLAFMGFVQLGLGCILFIKAARYLSAAEIGLIGLLESLLAPLWVWWGVGERPGSAALLGGVVVLGSLAVNELMSLRGKAAAESGAVEAMRL